MSNNFKKMFLTSLLVVLFVLSNIIGMKYTNFMGLTLSVNFIFYPFIYLCILLLINMFGKKEAYSSIIIAIFIQLFLVIAYSLIVNLGSQSMIPDMALEVNNLFKVNLSNILSSLIGLAVSSYILIYLYEYIRIIGYHLMGVIISTLTSLIIYGLINITVNTYSLGYDITLNMILCHVIMSVIITIIIAIMFYMMKDKENYYENSAVFIKELNIDIKDKNYKNDKPIEEVIELNNLKNQEKKKKKKKKRTNKSKINEKK